MNGIEKHAAFYRGYLPDDRSLVPLTVLLSATLALWLLVYLVAAVAEAQQNAGAARVASVTFIRDRPPANSPIPRNISAQIGHLIAWAMLCRDARMLPPDRVEFPIEVLG
jgi:hypothetical protein